MSEETKQADKTAAWGIVLAVGCSAISGLCYIIALMFSIQVLYPLLRALPLAMCIVPDSCCGRCK